MSLAPRLSASAALHATWSQKAAWTQPLHTIRCWAVQSSWRWGVVRVQSRSALHLFVTHRQHTACLRHFSNEVEHGLYLWAEDLVACLAHIDIRQLLPCACRSSK